MAIFSGVGGVKELSINASVPLESGSS